MLHIPLSPIPAQSFHILLDGQECALTLYLRGERLYLDLDADGRRVRTGAVCLDRTDILQTPTPHFRGGLRFVDTRGGEPPRHEGLDSRWKLVWLAPDEAFPEYMAWERL